VLKIFLLGKGADNQPLNFLPCRARCLHPDAYRGGRGRVWIWFWVSY